MAGSSRSRPWWWCCRRCCFSFLPRSATIRSVVPSGAPAPPLDKPDVKSEPGRKPMTKHMRAALLTSVLPLFCLAALPAGAADVTAERLLNADKEPQNWLSHHRTYDGQRFSPLDQINRTSIK